MGKNGLEVLECETKDPVGSTTTIFCRDDIADSINDGKLCTGEDQNCSCYQRECLKVVNEQLSSIFENEIQCNDIELTLCPYNTFFVDDVATCADHPTEREICSCVLSNCGAFLDPATALVLCLHFASLLFSFASLIFISVNLWRVFSTVQIRKWSMLGSGKLIRQSLFALFFFNLSFITTISIQLRIMFTSKRRDYTRAAEIRNNLETFSRIFNIWFTILSFIALVQLQRNWLDLAWNMAKYFEWKRALRHMRLYRIIAHLTFASMFAGFLFGFLVVLILGDEIKLKEASNIVTAIAFYALAIFSAYVKWRFESNLLKVLSPNSEKLLTRIIQLVGRVNSLFIVFLSISATGFMFDALDLLDNANYSEADYSFLIQTIPLLLCTSTVLYLLTRLIENKHSAVAKLTLARNVEEVEVYTL